jgi:hypothetical protein
MDVKNNTGEIHMKHREDALQGEAKVVLVVNRGTPTSKKADVAGVVLTRPLGPCEPHKDYFKQHVTIVERLK